MFWKTVLLTFLAVVSITSVISAVLMFSSVAVFYNSGYSTSSVKSETFTERRGGLGSGLKKCALAESQITDEEREQARNVIKNTCESNGAEDEEAAIRATDNNIINCMQGLFNIETINKEIEEAKPSGALNEVFKKYCAKTPELKTCLHTVVTGDTPCLDATVREYLHTVKNGTEQLTDFACHKDGDRIALFYAESGPECFREKLMEIGPCIKQAKEGISSIGDVTKLSIDQTCSKVDAMSNCAVNALKKCDSPVPGNMVESLFKFLRKSLPCKGLFIAK